MRSIEFKIVLSIVFFTLFLMFLERIQFSQGIKEQFINSQKSKHELLINTIAPIVSLNLSLGLDSASTEYLEQIARQNRDIISITLTDLNEKKILYEYKLEESHKIDKNNYNHSVRDIEDDFTKKKLAKIELHFSNREYQKMEMLNNEIWIKIVLITIVLLILFIFYIKYEFKALKDLATNVLFYDPKLNNFPLKKAKGSDEVSLIQNAIISMVNKINLYTDLLASHKESLEKKVHQRTVELEQSNRELIHLASIDPLTKLYNRRYFMKRAEDVSLEARKNERKISVMMLDIDNFKQVNDNYGHKVGDDVILHQPLRV